MTIQACISGTQYGVAIFVQDRRSFCIHPFKHLHMHACMHAWTAGALGVRLRSHLPNIEQMQAPSTTW